MSVASSISRLSAQRRIDPWHLAVVITALAFLVRLGWQLAVDFYVAPETFESDEVARNIILGRGPVYDFFGTEWRNFGMSFYPHLLAALHLLGGGPQSYLLIGLFQAASSAALALGTFALGSRLLDARTGVIAATIVALHPALVIYTSKVTELNADAAAAVLIAVAILYAARDGTARGWIRFGAAGALGALVRPTLGGAAWVLLGALALVQRRRVVVVAAVLLVIGMAPTSLRNLTQGHESAGTPGNCVQFWVGNNPAASGDAYAKDGRPILDSLPPDLEQRVVGRPEDQQGRAFCDAAFEFVRSQPLLGLGWWAQKFWYFWTFTPHAGDTYPVGWHELYRISYALEAVLAIGGIYVIWGRGDRQGLLLMALMALVIAASQSLFYVEGRHRLVLEPLLATAAAAGLLSVFDRVRPVSAPSPIRGHP